MKTRPNYFLIITICMLVCMSCSDSNSNNIGDNKIVSKNDLYQDTSTMMITKSAPEWANMLKHDTGWIGADGIYCVPMNGVEAPGKMKETNTFFWFSDCIIGNIAADTLQKNWEMLHNSVAVMKGDKVDPVNIQFFYRKDSAGHALSMFEPHTVNSQKFIPGLSL